MKKFKFWIASLVLVSLFFGACEQENSAKSQTESTKQENESTKRTPTDERVFETKPVDDDPSSCIIIGCKKDELPAELVIPDTIKGKKVTKIGEWAFESCMKIETLNLPDSITEIDESAFESCTDIETLDLSNCTSPITIGELAFKDCTGITTLKLPNSITEIDKKAFAGCTRVKAIDLSNCTSLSEIGGYAFSGCTGIETLDLSNCTSLTEIDRSDNYDLYDKNRGAFKDCTGITTLKLPDSITYIGPGAFEGCTGITSLDLSNCTSLTKIDGSCKYAIFDKNQGAFKNCTGIETLKLPDSITEIGKRAFAGCTKLKKVTFGKIDRWKAYNKSDYTDEVGDIKLDKMNDIEQVDALTKEHPDGYCDCYWKREE